MSLFGQTVNLRGKTGLFEPITLARRCIGCHTLRELAADAAGTAEEPNFVEAYTGCGTPAIIRGRESRCKDNVMCNQQRRQLTSVVRTGTGKHAQFTVMHVQSTSVSGMRAREKHAREKHARSVACRRHCPKLHKVFMEIVRVHRAHAHDNK